MDGQDAAFEAAVSMLGRRASSERQIREKLRTKGHPDADVDGAIERLVRAGYLDDRRLALETILEQCRRGRGPVRIEARLRELGIGVEVARLAWTEATEDYGVDPQRILAEQLRRRLPEAASACDRAILTRVYNALLRAGFDEGEVRSEMAPHMPDPDAADELTSAHDAATEFPVGDSTEDEYER